MTSGCGCLQFSCLDPGHPPVQEGNTRIIFTGVSGAWSTVGLYGYLDDPRFPISVANIPVNVSYLAVITGNAEGTSPWPINTTGVKAFGYSGPPSGSFDSWYDPNASTSNWAEDTRYPGKLVTIPSGLYVAGKAGTAQQKDKMFVQVELWYGSSSTKSLALGELTWNYSSLNSLIIGSKSQMYPNDGLWVQATADFPEPITYAWTVNDVSQSWNGPFVWVEFAENGYKTITATLTGADNSTVVKTWNVWVICAPPASPYADDCDDP